MGCDHGGWGETGTCLEIGLRGSSVIVTWSYAWNGNITFLIPIALSMGLLLDVCLTLPPGVKLMETRLMRRNSHGSISYFMT